MKRSSWLISKYLIQSVAPYFAFSWLLLSVILFFQQSARYSDIFFSLNIPNNLVLQLAFALVPNVIAFTCPMAVLVGVIIGLSRMLGDNELIAIRYAGVGNLQITAPIFVLGIILSAFTFAVNLYGVPFAARIVRQVALQTALYKLESPLEPGVFNSEINGYTIYVKNGDLRQGTWENIFIYNENKTDQTTRLITSKSGRIDSNDENTELVLDEALISTITESKSGSESSKFVSENIKQFRLAIKTKRGEIIEKLSGAEQTPDEMGLQELGAYADSRQGREKIEAQILWQRRIILSITPLIFSLLGTALVLRYNRGNRGTGVFLALIGLIIYYLVTLLGEQMARTNQINVSTASFFPLLLSSLLISYLFLFNRFSDNKIFRNFNTKIIKFFASSPIAFGNLTRNYSGKLFLQLKTRLLDVDIISNLFKYFLLTLIFLSCIYLIFTAFELWKFAGEIDNGSLLLLKYLMFLLPFVYLQLAPSATMIATLVTFVIKSRQNEVVSWTSAGQSVYRLLLPCFGLMILLGVFNWGIQEIVAPKTNAAQDSLRAQIRSRGKTADQQKKYWVANDRRIFSFEMTDFENATLINLKNLTIYEFSDANSQLKYIYHLPSAIWNKNKIEYSIEGEKRVLDNGKIETTKITDGELNVSSNPFNNINGKPSHLNRQEIREQIMESGSETEQRNLMVALEKKYTTLFLPLVITLFTAPFALSLNRKGRVVTVGYAIGVWLLFMGLTAVFEQFGLNGFVPPSYAVWSPLFLFSIIGAYLLTKFRT